MDWKAEEKIAVAKGVPFYILGELITRQFSLPPS
jgi:hypothetical protein